MQYEEDDKRMIAELTHVVQRNGVSNFSYSRFDGSGLRVPGFTNLAGDAIQPGESSIKAEAEEAAYWLHSGGDSGRNSLGIKEEEDLGMDLG